MQIAALTGILRPAQPSLRMLEGRTLALLPRLECSGVISVHCNLRFPSLSNSHVSIFRVYGITGVYHHVRLIFLYIFVEMQFHHVGKAGLELLASSDLPALAPQSAGITGRSHCAWPSFKSFTWFCFVLFSSNIGTPAWLPLPFFIHHNLQCPEIYFRNLWSTVETRFCHVGQAGLELLTSGDPPGLASQSAGITGCETISTTFEAWKHYPNSRQCVFSLENPLRVASPDCFVPGKCPDLTWLQIVGFHFRPQASEAMGHTRRQGTPPSKGPYLMFFPLLVLFGLFHICSGRQALSMGAETPDIVLQQLVATESRFVTRQNVSGAISLTATSTPRFKRFSCLSRLKMKFHHLGQAGLELLTSGDPLASASQSAGIIGMSHCTQRKIIQSGSSSAPVSGEKQISDRNVQQPIDDVL
ncbi:hypothetical protein AAY473_030262 [Plecturocebus cupreus]